MSDSDTKNVEKRVRRKLAIYGLALKKWRGGEGWPYTIFDRSDPERGGPSFRNAFLLEKWVTALDSCFGVAVGRWSYASLTINEDEMRQTSDLLYTVASRVTDYAYGE